MDAALADVGYRLRADGSMRSPATGWDGVTDDLLPAALALAEERDRLRHCGNPRCRWLFVDRSRKGNRIWCEAAVCGNRMRVGRHRRGPSAAD
jgi:predicted RNA-binding Zn ribbon-like protein